MRGRHGDNARLTLRAIVARLFEPTACIPGSDKKLKVCENKEWLRRGVVIKSAGIERSLSSKVGSARTEVDASELTRSGAELISTSSRSLAVLLW